MIKGGQLIALPACQCHNGETASIVRFWGELGWSLGHGFHLICSFPPDVQVPCGANIGGSRTAPPLTSQDRKRSRSWVGLLGLGQGFHLICSFLPHLQVPCDANAGGSRTAPSVTSQARKGWGPRCNWHLQRVSEEATRLSGRGASNLSDPYLWNNDSLVFPSCAAAIALMN
jgi:hypothetical protein